MTRRTHPTSLLQLITNSAHSKLRPVRRPSNSRPIRRTTAKLSFTSLQSLNRTLPAAKERRRLGHPPLNLASTFCLFLASAAGSTLSSSLSTAIPEDTYLNAMTSWSSECHEPTKVFANFHDPLVVRDFLFLKSTITAGWL